MLRKFLFLVFSADACRVNHAFMHALDLAKARSPGPHHPRRRGDREAQRKRKAASPSFFRGIGPNLVVGLCATAAHGWLHG